MLEFNSIDIVQPGPIQTFSGMATSNFKVASP